MRRVTLKGLVARKLRLALTALAIVLGVVFITGTLILGDTLNSTFNNLIGSAYQHVSFEIRGKAAFSLGSAGTISGNNRPPVPASIVAKVRALPGVAYVNGQANGSAQYLARDGNAIGANGQAGLGFAFDPNRQLSPYRLAQGHAPVGPDQVVMDRGTALKYHFAVGERVMVNLPNRAQRFTISGTVTFNNDNNLGGLTLAGFSQATAQRAFNLKGRFNAISVLAAPSANTVRLQRQIQAVLPPDAEVVSGQDVVNELTKAIDNELSFISTLLLIFAIIALLVGSFTIFNTFSITVSQRTRELALLRVVGASRRQVFRSVISEAAITGLLAALIGLGLGVLAALGLKALLGAFGIDLPSASLVFRAHTPIAALVVGVGVTVASAIVPARRAVRVAPVAALTDVRQAPSAAVRRRRLMIGAAFGVIGIIVLLLGLRSPQIAVVALGALGLLIAVTVLAPVAARPLARMIGRPLEAIFGVAGRLGRENAMRNSRRTAQTAAALMIGLALVSVIAVLASSINTSVTSSVDQAIKADYIVSGTNGFSRSVVSAVARVHGVTTATAVYQGKFEFDGSVQTLTAASAHDFPRTVTLNVSAGSEAPALTGGELMIDTNVARAHHLYVGSIVNVRFVKTGAGTMRIGGIFNPNPLVGGYVAGEAFFTSHYNSPVPVAVLLKTAPGTPNLNPVLNNRVLKPYANVSSKSRAQFKAAEHKQINQLLGLVYVLLALAVVIALIGIINALLLSVFERTREIGLLRAVGMRRAQVRRMIRSESVIIAVFGAIVGIVTGACLGAAFADALRNDGVTNVSIPVPSLIAFVILAALLGLAAAAWPARRAARLDVLSAIASE